MVWCVQKSRSTVTTQLAPGVMCQVPINPLSLFTTRSIFLEVQCAQKCKKKFTYKNIRKKFLSKGTLWLEKILPSLQLLHYFSLFLSTVYSTEEQQGGKVVNLFSSLFGPLTKKRTSMRRGGLDGQYSIYSTLYTVCVYNIEGPTYRVHYISNRMMCSGHTKRTRLLF